MNRARFFQIATAALVVAVAAVGQAQSVGADIVAAPSCESLFEGFDTLAAARSFRSVTTVRNGDRELLFVDARTERSEAGEVETVILEQRSSLPIPLNGFGGDGGDRGGQDASESCRGADVSAEAEGRWRVTLDSEGGPLQESSVLFVELRSGSYLPLAFEGAFDTRFLLIRFRGTFETRFAEWVLADGTQQHQDSAP